MIQKFPTHLNLEFFANPLQSTSDENALLCHVRHDDYGNRIQAIPLKVNANGNIILDFNKAVDINID
jgi:hypothetical protein